MSEIGNSLCVRNDMILTSVLNIDREPWGDYSILIKVMVDFTYVHVKSDVKNIYVRQNMHLIMTVTSNPCINQIVWDLVDNRSDEPICVLEDNGREKEKLSML